MCRGQLLEPAGQIFFLVSAGSVYHVVIRDPRPKVFSADIKTEMLLVEGLKYVSVFRTVGFEDLFCWVFAVLDKWRHPLGTVRLLESIL